MLYSQVSRKGAQHCKSTAIPNAPLSSISPFDCWSRTLAEMMMKSKPSTSESLFTSLRFLFEDKYAHASAMAQLNLLTSGKLQHFAKSEVTTDTREGSEQKMAEALNLQRFRNPWALQLQKLALELKCPLCLNLLDKPIWLPCSHIFCNSCIPRTANVGSECPACNHQYSDQEIGPAPNMENIVTIYSSLDAISKSVFQPFSSDQFQASLAMTLPDRANGVPSGSSKEQVSDGRKVITLTTNERNLAILNDRGNDQNSPACQIDRGSVSTCKADLSFSRVETEEMEMNQVPELLPESPPSFGDAKDIGSKVADSGGKESNMEKLTLKRSSQTLADADGGGEPFRSHPSNNFAKRQKTLTFCSSETGGNNSYNHEKISTLGSSATSNCNLGPEHDQCLPFAESITLAHSSDSTMTACAFCHSSKITEETGSMTHFANGREVAGDLSKFSNVIPVHIKCIDWTPRVFYEGDYIRNLESELGRAAKLKCSLCGLKGAALGCFAKSCRRTYHAPCAFEIQECRWDCEDFLMLCPTHNSLKFPRERSKLRKSVTMKHPLSADSTQITSTVCDFWTASPNGPLKWVFCGSALSSEEKCLLIKFAGMCGATVSKFWSPNVTHVIAATDEKGACTRTLKVLMAILKGRWILTMEWVKACMEASVPMNEEPYEVGLDNHGCIDGPKTGRLRISNNAPKLFDGLKFYFSGEFLPAYKVDLLDLVRTAGGTVIESMEQLIQSRDALSVSSSLLIVYNRDPPRGCAVGEENSILWQRLAEAKCLANMTNSQVIQHTWILESIAACKLHPFASQKSVVSGD